MRMVRLEEPYCGLHKSLTVFSLPLPLSSVDCASTAQTREVKRIVRCTETSERGDSIEKTREKRRVSCEQEYMQRTGGEAY